MFVLLFAGCLRADKDVFVERMCGNRDPQQPFVEKQPAVCTEKQNGFNPKPFPAASCIVC